MKKKIEIKDILGKVLFSYECEDNSVKKTVEEAVKQDISLCNANLYNSNLRGSNLRGANLYGVNLCAADLNGANLYGANLCNANLNGANLRGANLRNAALYDADLCCANLSGADLNAANLNSANLRGADLCGANLNNANLCCANLSGAELCGADLRCAYLSWTNLYGANLDDVKNVPFIPLACPSEGPFFGWKKVNNYLIKLFIPEDAKRSSATTNKCRCDKAKVLEITNLETNEHINEIINDNYAKCVYKVGEMVYPDKFDDNRWDECSNGIHFFVNKKEAIKFIK